MESTGLEFHGAEVAGGYDLPHMGARIQTLPMQDHWVFVLLSFLNVGFLFELRKNIPLYKIDYKNIAFFR